jgi:putative inorganic carbon (HCO3(-)) transporter
LIVFVAVFLLLAITANNENHFSNYSRFALWPMITISLVVGYLQVFNLDPFNWAEEDRVVLLFGNSNFAGSALGTLILIPLIFFLSNTKIFYRLINLSILILIFILGYYTKTLQFYVISIVTILTFFTVLKLDKFMQFSKLRKSFFITSALFSLAGGFYFFWNQILTFANLTDRINSTIIGIKIFQDHPVFGVGIEQFWRFQGEYKSFSQAQYIGDNYIVDKAHNVFIDYFANGGVLTGILFIVFVVVSIVEIYKISSAHMANEKRLEVAFFSAIWFGYILQLFFTTDSLFTMSFAFLNLGLLVSLGRQSFNDEKFFKGKNGLKNSWYIRVALSVLMVLLSWLTVVALKNDLMIKSVVTNRLSDGNRILDAISDFPNPRGTEIIIAHAITNVENCNFATAVSDELIQVDNRSAQGWYFKSFCSDYIEDQVLALKYINEAIKFQPTNIVYLEFKFKLQIRMKMFDGASLTLNQIEEVNPSFSDISQLRSTLRTNTVEKYPPNLQ